MRMRAPWVLVLCLTSSLAIAQEETRRPRFEVMPAIGYGVGGSFENATTQEGVDVNDAEVVALSLRMQTEYEKEWELFYSRQRTDVEQGSPVSGTPGVDLDIEYLHLGGSYFPNEHAYAPYVVGGLGVTRFKPSGAGLSDTTDFSLSVGLGIRFPLTDHFALRLEGRGFLTFVDTDTAFFCSSGEDGGACLIRAKGSSVFQFQGLLGFAVTF